MNKENAELQVEALASLGSQEEMIIGLRAIAGRHGKVLGVSRLPALVQSEKGVATFLIDFETTREALIASRQMKCPVFGYSTLIVSIPLLNNKPGGL
jgi:hypothetical protein